jgi:microcystin-dependent protein
MAVLWTYSLVPWHNEANAPYAGAKAYFFDVGTTTPQIVYTDASLSIPHDHPVVANANGEFPAVFITEETSHRLRITTSADVTLRDVDNISVPTTTPVELPTSNTALEFLFQTGDIKMRWSVTAPTGWVRANGRTIGSVSSGATERANADTEALFLLLWPDTSLSVSGGRGGTAAGDWAANKTIALPDFRGRVPVGPDSFGNSAAGRITDAVLGVDSDTLGLAGGAETHTLTLAQTPAHDHGGSTSSNGAHTHTALGGGSFFGSGSDGNTHAGGAFTFALRATTSSDGAHTHTISSAGSGNAHNNLQPSYVVPYFIKL